MNFALLLMLVGFLPQTDQSSFVVGISFRFDASASPFCAGTLIARRWVVTSASCVFSDRKVMKDDKLAVGFGEDGKQDLARVAKVIAHKRYVVDIKKRDFSRKRNIALLELESDVDGTKYKSACILGKARKRRHKATFWDLLTGKDSEFKAPEKYSLFGWQLDPLLPGALSDKIQEKQVKLDFCKGHGSRRLCINSDSCEGDYGGPLIEGESTLIGVSRTDVSQTRCCRKWMNKYGCNQMVYTNLRLIRYRKWIARRIRRMQDWHSGVEQIC